MTEQEMIDMLAAMRARLDHLEEHLHASNEATGCRTCWEQVRGY